MTAGAAPAPAVFFIDLLYSLRAANEALDDSQNSD